MMSRMAATAPGSVTAMMKREDYKAVKHMDKARLERYLETIYQRGYQAGVKAMAEQIKGKATAPAPATQPEG